MAHAHPVQPKLSAEEYLRLENDGAVRHEFIDGQIFAMAGGSERHSLIKVNMIGAILRAKPTGCRLFDGDMKLCVEADGETRFYYPDVFVSCEPGDQDQYVRRDAVLIVEVLSPSTERVDRFEKFNAYTKMPTLLEYVLVSQDAPSIEVRRRRLDWVVERVGLGAMVTLESISLTMSVDEVYADIDYLRKNSQ